MSALGHKRTYATQKVISALPRERTFAVYEHMSAMGQKRTLAAAHKSSFLPMRIATITAPIRFANVGN